MRYGLAVIFGLILALQLSVSSPAQPLATQTPAITYPLPDRLTQLPDNAAGDYFDQINFPKAGALIWTAWPIRVYIDSDSSDVPRKAAWLKAVQTALTDWRQYLDIVETPDRPSANIIIQRRSVPIQRDPKTGKLNRFRLAETRFELFLGDSKKLHHRMTIDLSPNQADGTLLAGARHEIGHAVGLWGHSDRETDVMYFSQVGRPSSISLRDLNTLKRVYRSATRLGTEISP
jgi:predicted Zn-dependent protease